MTTDGDITDSAFIPGLGGLPEELATYCSVDDPKKPTFVGAPDFSVVQYCPEEAMQPPMVTTGSVAGFQARIVFDELLDPDVETLIDSDTLGPCTGDSVTCDGTFVTTQPVTLICDGQSVAYDGYYVPNGNLVSWPPGPSLVVFPTDFVATSAMCSVELKDSIVDKEGNAVPAEQRGTGGAYKWQLAGLDIIGTSPEDGEDLADDAPVVISFNAPLDDTTVDGTDITVEDSGGPVAVTIAVDPGTGDVIITPNAATWTDGETYTVTVLDTATINDIRGGAYVGGGLSFTFNAVMP